MRYSADSHAERVAHPPDIAGACPSTSMKDVASPECNDPPISRSGSMLRAEDRVSVSRWTTKSSPGRRVGGRLWLDINEGITTVGEWSRQFDTAPSQVEGRIDLVKAGTGYALKVKPEDIREQHETQIKALQEDTTKRCRSRVPGE